MTIKTFREAYVAYRFLQEHQSGCSRCERHNVWGEPPCVKAQSANAAVDKANTLLGFTDPRMSWGDAWFSRSRFLR